MKPKHTPIERIFAATRYSKQGLTATFKTEAAFRQELGLFILFLPLLLLLPLPLTMKMILLAVNTLVLLCELLNSAIEAVIDMVSPEYHELAKKGKDAGSAAVFVSLMLALVLWSTAIASLFL